MVSYEAVRRWVNHFGPVIAANLRRRRSKPHTSWHLDAVYLKIDAVDAETFSSWRSGRHDFSFQAAARDAEEALAMYI
jgi:transposase-like protein